MERTNITDKGYSFNGKNYVYETRKDANNNPYQVAIESTAPTSTIQTSTAQRKEDNTTMQKFDTIAATKGISTPNAVASNPAAPTPEKTPVETAPVVTTPAPVAQPWDINKNDTLEAQARAGGGGGSLIVAGSAGTNTNTANAKTGGDGAVGVSSVIVNNDF